MRQAGSKRHEPMPRTSPARKRAPAGKEKVEAAILGHDFIPARTPQGRLALRNCRSKRLYRLIRRGTLAHMTANEKELFKLEPKGYHEKFEPDGERYHIKFIHEANGVQHQVIGELLVRTLDGFEYVEIHTGRRYIDDPPNAYWIYKLPQQYVDRIVPIEPTASDPKLVFELTIPLREEDCISRSSN